MDIITLLLYIIRLNLDKSTPNLEIIRLHRLDKAAPHQRHIITTF